MFDNFRLLFRDSPTLLLILDETLVCRDLSSAWRMQLALPQSDTVAIPIAELFDLESNPALHEQLERALEHGTTVHQVEVALLVSLGNLKVKIFAWQTRQHDGDHPCLMVAATDLTEFNLKSNQLSQLQIQHQLILDAAGEGIYGLDHEGRITFGNAATTEILGWKIEDARGQFAHDIHHHSHADGSNYPREACPIYAALNDGEIHRIDNEVFWHTDGSAVPVEYVSSPIIKDGKPSGAVVIFRDITERKELALMAARDQAQTEAKAKADFLASMSHEIRTPMNGVLGMIDLLRQTELDSDQKQMLQTIRESGQSLLTIVNDILDFSKIEAGKLELENIPLSIVDVMEGSIQTLAVNAAKKGLRLIAYIDPELPQLVDGDPVRLGQIILNLGGNAIKFTDSGQIVFRADLVDSTEDAGLFVRFSVVDQGIGISKEAQAKLFQPYSQAEASTTRQFGGTGLGLTICKSLTQMMGGTISVSSDTGEGAKFCVTLPLTPSATQPEKPGTTDLAGLNLLLVNDNSVERIILKEYLEHWNTKVDVVDTLHGLLNRCYTAIEQGTAYDVVVLGPQWTREQIIPIGDAAKEAGIKARFVFLLQGTRHRVRMDNRRGIFLDVNPLRRTAFISAVAIAAGRKSPEVHYKEEVEDMKATGKALSIEEARQLGTLILVAEDNATNRDVIGRQLILLGYTCEMAEDGKIALDAWRNNSYALLLTDCNMPNMDGFELTKAIRQDEEKTGSHAGIIAITANAMEAEMDRCLKSGMDDFISKPIDMKDLRQSLRKWMPKFKLKTEPVNKHNAMMERAIAS